MQVNKNIFRMYDIRGYVDKDLSEEFAFLLGRSFGTFVKDSNKGKDVKDLAPVAIGYDCRHSSEGYANALAKGITTEGLDVIITGQGPTPQLYYAIYDHKASGGIQVTGSHNPPDMNGFKMCIGTKTLSGDEITDLYNRLVELPEAQTEGHGSVSKDDFEPKYFQMLVDNCKPHIGKRKLKVVADAGNGVAGTTGPKVLKALGIEVEELYCNPDGNFPNHHPDPSEVETLEDLIEKVKETKADFGIAWDGDGDRVGVVDDKGNVIPGDLLLLLYGREVIKNQDAKPTIIGDVKCSNRLFSDLQKNGANAVMWKTGHSLVKAKLRETNAELAGEMSGHMFFNDRFFGFDDALYAAARFAELVSNSEEQVSNMLSGLPEAFSTPEIRLDCPDEVKFKIAEGIKDQFPDYDVCTIDGARVTFEKGWGLVRASNTQPVLVLRFEAESEELLNEYRSRITTKIDELKGSI